MIVQFLIALLVGRVLGWPILPILVVAINLYIKPYSEAYFPRLVLMGILVDIAIGKALGLTSLLLLVTYVEISIYKEKVDSTGIGSMFLLGVWTALQTVILWGLKIPLWHYFLNGAVSLIGWIFISMIQRQGIGSAGVYLRKTR